MTPRRSNLNNPSLTTALFAVLVKRLGGNVEICQADLDEIAFNSLEEEGREDGSLRFTLLEREKSL